MARLLIQREQREMVDGHSRIIRDERIFFVADVSRDFSTPDGNVKKADLAKPDGSMIKTTTGVELVLLTPTFSDTFQKLRKLPQTVMPKDIGLIIAETGIGKDGIVLDAGAGSGALAGAIANIVKHVITYELREDFIENLKKNFELLGLTNITLKHADVTKECAEKDIDLVTLDLPEPWQAFASIVPALKIGGHLVCYIPSVPQLMDCVDAIKKDSRLLFQSATELIRRDWIVQGKRTRPDNEMLGHTAFLVFARKIQQ